jgi:hypothetical protein
LNDYDDAIVASSTKFKRIKLTATSDSLLEQYASLSAITSLTVMLSARIDVCSTALKYSGHSIVIEREKLDVLYTLAHYGTEWAENILTNENLDDLNVKVCKAMTKALLQLEAMLNILRGFKHTL